MGVLIAPVRGSKKEAPLAKTVSRESPEGTWDWDSFMAIYPIQIVGYESGKHKPPQDKRTGIFVRLFGRISGALRRKPGFSLQSFLPRRGKKVFPLQSLARSVEEFFFTVTTVNRLLDPMKSHGNQPFAEDGEK
jgi:hypothetical protein